MFRIRRIHDDILPQNRSAIVEVQRILRARFPGVRSADVERLSERLRSPFRERFRPILYIAEEGHGTILGFALVLVEPSLRFAWLDFIANAPGVEGRGVGAALYERVRDEALGQGTRALLFECLPDDPKAYTNPDVVRDNASRLRFYERYGARPVARTAWETPIDPESREPMPHLVFDGLDRGEPLRREFAKKVARAILEHRYAAICPPEYVERVVESFKDDPIQLREPRYPEKVEPAPRRATAIGPEPIAVFVSDVHHIHHVKERGYVEAPVRVPAIEKELRAGGFSEFLPAQNYPETHIRAVHDGEFVDYLKHACETVPLGKSQYPYVFPVRNAARKPKDYSVLAGYYCIDTFTPIHRNAYPAARRAVDCALAAADEILDGRRLAYALIRPPGHHAEHCLFGGFCYFNNNAVAAHHLSGLGKVAILDIDYHHGNGQQDIFWTRGDVLTVSIHGSPEFAYPYFSGFDDERGEGEGLDRNRNYPLSEELDGKAYRTTLELALAFIAEFDPAFLVVALGLDPAKADPTGTWSLSAKDFEENGRMIGALHLPTVVIQEGGYRTRTLGRNARSFFQGLLKGSNGL